METEALAAECRAEVGMQHLDGDIAIVLDLACEVHGGHTALAEFAVEALAVGQRGRQALGVARHDRARRPLKPMPTALARPGRRSSAR